MRAKRRDAPTRNAAAVDVDATTRKTNPNARETDERDARERAKTAIQKRRAMRASTRDRIAVTPRASLAVDVARWTLSVPTMYAMVSINEYITHRYYQHAEFNKNETLKKVWCFFTRQTEAPKVGGGGHIEHHAETLDDMSLRVDDKWMKSEPAAVLEGNTYRGTAFEWDITGLMTMQMVITCVPVLALMGFSAGPMAALIGGSTLAHALIWNSLHPAMHGLNEVPLQDGVPSLWLARYRESKYYDYLYLNHSGHHVLSGQCNYNVCCPLVDHVLGTYVEPEVWMKKTRVPFGKEHREFYPAGEYARNLAAKAAAAAIEGALQADASADEGERDLVAA